MTYGVGGPPDPFGGSPRGGDPFGGAPASLTPPPTAPAAEVNALATLSVVFAFVFAPAGAVLGHLGLAQIGRTGQRGRDRALIGLTLSYVFVTVAVVSLVVWLTIGAPAAPSPLVATSSAATPPAAMPTVNSTTSSAPPTADPGPTLTHVDPPAPLLDVEEMKAILGTPVNSVAPAPVPVADLLAYPPSDVVDIALKTQGAVSDSDCAAAVFAGTAQAFGDREPIQGIHSITMAQPGPQGTQSVTETAVVYYSPTSAETALTRYLTLLEPCNGRTVTLTTAPQGTTHPLRLDPQGPHQYTFAGAAAGQQVYMFRHEATSDRFAVERGFLVKDNVLVDVSVRGRSLFADQQEVLSEILKKMP